PPTHTYPLSLHDRSSDLACPGRIIVAVDARDGVVAIDGWTTSGGITAVDLAHRAAAWGAAALLYTDVARDGLGGGPNVAATAALDRKSTRLNSSHRTISY